MVETRVHFHDRLASLQQAVIAVGHEVRRSIPDATDAWLRRDCEAGRAVDARTAGWSARARDIELAAYELIATQQPMASDLRRLTALVRLTEEVSRSGDLVAHVARSACFDRQATDFTPGLRSMVVEMAAMAVRQWEEALDAYAAADPAAADRVRGADAALDDLHRELYVRLLEGEVGSAAAVDLALLGRFYERLGDHAVDIAERARFIGTGEVGSAAAVDLALLGRFYERLGDHAVDIAERARFIGTGEVPRP